MAKTTKRKNPPDMTPKNNNARKKVEGKLHARDLAFREEMEGLRARVARLEDRVATLEG